MTAPCLRQRTAASQSCSHRGTFSSVQAHTQARLNVRVSGSRSRPGRTSFSPPQAISTAEACRLLGLDQSRCSRAELRAAYLERMRQFHPDVNPLRDTHQQATALNQAYETLQRAWEGTGHPELRDVFDDPEGPPDLLFVNPFACNASPLLWRELQEVAMGATDDPEQALANAGVFASGMAVCYLTADQLASVEADLAAMEQGVQSVEITSWFVSDCLLRAARANNRMPARGGRR